MSPILVPTSQPPLSAKISVNLTETEKDVLVKLAHEQNLSMSALARRYIQQGLVG